MHVLKELGLGLLCTWAYAFIGIRLFRQDAMEYRKMLREDWGAIIVVILFWPFFGLIEPFVGD